VRCGAESVVILDPLLNSTRESLPSSTTEQFLLVNVNDFTALERELFFLFSSDFMKIAGLQRTTLIDYPGKIACTVFLHGCNFRCGFCYNPDLVTKEFVKGFTEDEILNFLKKRRGKLEAVCITGGEPLITLDKDFLKKIKGLGYLIKIDTNGSFPQRLKEMITENLVDYIAMDIKASRENYSNITEVEIPIQKIEESIKMIHDFGNYEFRTTVIEKFHDSKEIGKIGEWINEIIKMDNFEVHKRQENVENRTGFSTESKLSGNPEPQTPNKPKNYFLQGFKNQGEFIDSSFKKEKNITEKRLKELKKIAEEYFEKVEIRI
jgi:pyruvate formate lyase activating enzyme